jgi:hypothetical protein
MQHARGVLKHIISLSLRCFWFGNDTEKAVKFFQPYASFHGLYFYSDSVTFLCHAVFIEISVSNTGD